MLLLLLTATLCCIPLCLSVSLTSKTRSQLYQDAARQGDVAMLRYFRYTGNDIALQAHERKAAISTARQHNHQQVLEFLNQSD
ncbi:MAG: hypothetical protein GYB58_00435 [Gammaproteobacteria bacterium]|nr:hypothetical protein [Gammaproteobacteria bacterium]